jgi:broad specificity phosphatase PhoE
MTKDIYFIRHGQTVKNTKHVHQHYDEPLSEVGKKQAREVAEFVKTLDIDELVTSPFARARQTAAIISEVVNVPYTIDVSVHETIRPLYLYGKPHRSLATIRYIWNLFVHRSDDSCNDDGAENMFAVRNRVHDVKDMIMEMPEQHIGIVSHAVFIDMFVHLVCAERSLSFWKFIHLLIFVKKMPNTSIIHIQYRPSASAGVCQWQFVGMVR